MPRYVKPFWIETEIPGGRDVSTGPGALESDSLITIKVRHNNEVHVALKIHLVGASREERYIAVTDKHGERLLTVWADDHGSSDSPEIE